MASNGPGERKGIKNARGKEIRQFRGVGRSAGGKGVEEARKREVDRCKSVG